MDAVGTQHAMSFAHNIYLHILQVTFVSPDGIWAIRFGSAAQYAAFTEKYNDRLFENTFKVDNDEANRNKVRMIVDALLVPVGTTILDH